MSEALGLAGLLTAMQPRPVVVEAVPDLAAVRAQGWDAGFAAGCEHAEGELAPLRLALGEAAAALRAACVVDVDGLRPVVAALVTEIAEAVLMAELRLDAAVMLRLVEAGLALVRTGEAAVLRVHPATLPLLGDLLDVVADAGVAVDGFMVSGPNFVIEAGLRARLGEIMEAMA